MNTNNVVNVGSKSIKRIIIIAVVILVLLIAGLSCFTVIQPGHTGVVVNLGKVSSTVLEEVGNQTKKGRVFITLKRYL